MDNDKAKDSKPIIEQVKVVVGAVAARVAEGAVDAVARRARRATTPKAVPKGRGAKKTGTEKAAKVSAVSARGRSASKGEGDSQDHSATQGFYTQKFRPQDCGGQKECFEAYGLAEAVARETMIDRDVAIIICSRGREDVLLRFLSDLHQGFTPALDGGGLSHCIWVYAQGYSQEYIAGLNRTFAGTVASQNLVITPSMRPHGTIGDVVQTAIRTVHDKGRYELAMLMDDDSIYTADHIVDGNLRRAARTFIDCNHRAYSIKLGTIRDLAYKPFVNVEDPIMPFKEKMLWVNREVLDEVLVTPRFVELSVGEDVVIAAVAWLPRAEACFGVYGMATFLHLGYEPSDDLGVQEVQGGYAELMGFQGPLSDAAPWGKYDQGLRRGVAPYHVFPDVFVPPGHRRYEFSGIRQEMIPPFRPGPTPSRGR